MWFVELKKNIEHLFKDKTAGIGGLVSKGIKKGSKELKQIEKKMPGLTQNIQNELTGAAIQQGLGAAIPQNNPNTQSPSNRPQQAPQPELPPEPNPNDFSPEAVRARGDRAAAENKRRFEEDSKRAEAESAAITQRNNAREDANIAKLMEQQSEQQPQPQQPSAPPQIPTKGMEKIQEQMQKTAEKEQKIQQEQTEVGDELGTTTKSKMLLAVVLCVAYDIIDIILPLVSAGISEIPELAINFIFEFLLMRLMGTYMPKYTWLEIIPIFDMLPIYSFAAIHGYTKFSADSSHANKLGKQNSKLESKMQKGQKRLNAELRKGQEQSQNMTGNAGLFQKIAGGAEGIQKPPIGSIILIVSAILLGIFIFNTASVEDKTTLIPALLPIVLFIVGIISLKLPLTNPMLHSGALILGILLCLGSMYGCATQTAPTTLALAQQKITLSSLRGGLQATGEEVSHESQSGFSGFLNDAVLEYRNSMALARGDHIDGDVDQSVKTFVGVKLAPAYLPNPERINENEINSLEFGARIKGFDSRNELNVRTNCFIKPREAESFSKALKRASKGESSSFEPGTSQRRRPESFKGTSFDRDLTCYPRPETCGKYIVTLFAEADDLATSSQMTNNIIAEEVLEQRLRTYAQSKGVELTPDTVNSAILEIYPGLGSYRSLSEKGAIKVVMATRPISLNGVSDESELTLRTAIENALDGVIDSVNNIEIIIRPDGYLQPLDGFCDNWNFNDGKIVLANDYLSSTDFTAVRKGAQKVLPSCKLVPLQGVELTERVEINFLALVDYNYKAWQEHNLEITNNDGSRCTTTQSEDASEESESSESPTETTA